MTDAKLGGVGCHVATAVFQADGSILISRTSGSIFREDFFGQTKSINNEPGRGQETNFDKLLLHRPENYQYRHANI